MGVNKEEYNKEYILKLHSQRNHPLALLNTTSAGVSISWPQANNKARWRCGYRLQWTNARGNMASLE